jgi:hypothetical protein
VPQKWVYFPAPTKRTDWIGDVFFGSGQNMFWSLP